MIDIKKDEIACKKGCRENIVTILDKMQPQTTFTVICCIGGLTSKDFNNSNIRK